MQVFDIRYKISVYLLDSVFKNHIISFNICILCLFLGDLKINVVWIKFFISNSTSASSYTCKIPPILNFKIYYFLLLRGLLLYLLLLGIIYPKIVIALFLLKLFLIRILILYQHRFVNLLFCLLLKKIRTTIHITCAKNYSFFKIIFKLLLLV